MWITSKLLYSGATNLDDLQDRLATIMIRRLKEEVLHQLPEKRRQKIHLHVQDSKLTRVRYQKTS